MSAGGLDTIVVLAGGLATRMRPLTEKLPKAMLDINGEPFIAHQLRLLKREGLEHVVLCLGYLADQVIDFVGDGSRFGLRVSYSLDGDKLLGTGGAIRKALPLVGDSFFVTYGDSYLDINYAAVAERFATTHSDGLMVVYQNSDKLDVSNVVFDGSMVVNYSKRERRPEMDHIDYGLGILRRTEFQHYQPDGVLDLADVYANLAKRGQLVGYEVSTRFYEIGSPLGLADTRSFLS